VLLQLLMPLLLLQLQETMKTGVILHRKHAIFYLQENTRGKKIFSPAVQLLEDKKKNCAVGFLDNIVQSV
jgi:hypothetical protein